LTGKSSIAVLAFVLTAALAVLALQQSMSYSSSRRKALDSSIIFVHRASNARSCAMLVGEKWRMPRSRVIETVQKRTGVNLDRITEIEEIEKAISELDILRREGIASD
jgi:hypothetical protein